MDITKHTLPTFHAAALDTAPTISFTLHLDEPAHAAPPPPKKTKKSHQSEEQTPPQKRRGSLLPTLLKVLFSLLITLLAFGTAGTPAYLTGSLLELGAILLVSLAAVSRWPRAGQLLALPLLLLYNAQTLVMRFSSSFTSLVMLTNLVFLSDLSGKFGRYLALVVPMLVLTLLPLRAPRLQRKWAALCAAAGLAVEMTVCMFFAQYSPLFNTYTLLRSYHSYQSTASLLQNMSTDVSHFYRPALDSYVDAPQSLPKQPNVLIIFTEGLSQSIVEDGRGIMPHLRQLEQTSLRFDNYYNHTFATLRGLIGQLYSGHQFDNMDKNELISLQSIFAQQGYQTAFLNTEPNNSEFTTYLNNLKFQQLVTDETLVDPATGYIHDKEAYALLMRTLEEQHKSSQPFFTCIYTYGTHVSLGSKDAVFGDGSSDLLNRFYNADLQFGAFWEQFLSSELAEDTVVIFTADHAAYVDEDFPKAFPDYRRDYSDVDRIPLYIYHKDITPQAVDAQGRNSLDLAPTVLDYLDLSAENFFLGESLFAPKAAGFAADTVFYCFNVISTDGGQLQPLSGPYYDRFMDLLTQYFYACRQQGREDSSMAEQMDRDYALTQLDADSSVLTITLKTQKEYTNVWFPVWSSENGQDDIVWYRAARNEAGDWSVEVPLSLHNDRGIYNIHAYEGDEAPKTNILATEANVPDYPPHRIDVAFDFQNDALLLTMPAEEALAQLSFRVTTEDPVRTHHFAAAPDPARPGLWRCTVPLAVLRPVSEPEALRTDDSAPAPQPTADPAAPLVLRIQADGQLPQEEAAVTLAKRVVSFVLPER